MDFNPATPKIMHVDINSCFATIEQQANPFLRGLPVAVGAYTTNSGCILAASYEAKAFGVKTGMRVQDGRSLCPNLIILPPDPDKYRFIHLKMREVLGKYSNLVTPKSIDEFSLDFKEMLLKKSMLDLGFEIKEKIKTEIGEAIIVSVGISTNRYLAKTAAGYKKPDGLFEIHKDNSLEVYQTLKLTDLCGIKTQNEIRLNKAGIYTVFDFYNADLQKLKIAFRSINSYYWYMRLHGYEVDSAETQRKSFGNQYALPRPIEEKAGLLPVITKLCEKTGKRLRKKGFVAKGVHLAIAFRDHTYWHKGKKLINPIFDSRDIYKEMVKLLALSPLRDGPKSVRLISITCFNLEPDSVSQLDLTVDVNKKQSLTKALDKINTKFGNFTIVPARMTNNEEFVLDRIAFGGMSEL